MPLQIYGLRTAVLKEKCDIFAQINKALKKNSVKIKNKDILIISSKVLALSQGRIIDLRTIKPGAKAKKMKFSRYGAGKEDPRIIELVLREADKVFTGTMMLALKDGILIPEAGIDLSNTRPGYATLWPDNPFSAARKLREKLCARFKLKHLGVVISDSHCQPLRLGTTGLAIAWAGFKGVKDIRGERDIYGKPMRVTQEAVADNIASSALLIMGEAGGRTPFAIARGANVKFTARKARKSDFFVAPKNCIFNGVYAATFKKNFI